MAPKFASGIELIRAEAIDAIRALTAHLEVSASSRWGPFFACIEERNYSKAASFYEAMAVQEDPSFASALAGVLANLWHARYEEARSAASRLANDSTVDERSYERIVELIDFATEVEGTYARNELADARPRVPAKTRFVILHDFRVGSTWVVASLNQHERVICYPEFLVGASAEQQAQLLSLMSTGGLPEIFGVYAVAPKYHPVSPYRKKHIDAVGFKTKLHDIRDHSWFRTFLKGNEFKVIRLYREDVLKQAVSLCNAERLFSERGQYNVRSGIDERIGPLRLDSERLMEKINRLREERETTDEFVETLELPTLLLSYEEILEEPSTAASRLGACLEIDGLTLGTTFAKATSDKLEEAVENWDEIITALKATPYEPSEEQNSEQRQSASSRLRKVGFFRLRAPPAAACMHIFLAIEPTILGTLPKSLAARGNLESVNGVAAPADLSLWSGAAASFGGWCCRTEEAHGSADSRYFFLERGDGQLRYYVHVPSRIQRDDVAEAAPELPKWVTRFSGFDFVADLQHLEPGEYRLGVVHETEEACYEFLFANRLRVVS